MAGAPSTVPFLPDGGGPRDTTGSQLLEGMEEASDGLPRQGTALDVLSADAVARTVTAGRPTCPLPSPDSVPAPTEGAANGCPVDRAESQGRRPRRKAGRQTGGMRPAPAQRPQAVLRPDPLAVDDVLQAEEVDGRAVVLGADLGRGDIAHRAVDRQGGQPACRVLRHVEVTGDLDAVAVPEPHRGALDVLVQREGAAVRGGHGSLLLPSSDCGRGRVPGSLRHRVQGPRDRGCPHVRQAAAVVPPGDERAGQAAMECRTCSCPPHGGGCRCRPRRRRCAAAVSARRRVRG